MKTTRQPIHLHHKKNGFSLLELLTALAVSAMLILMLITVFKQSSKAWTNAEAQVEIYTVARNVLNLMDFELSQAYVSPRMRSADNFGNDSPFIGGGRALKFYTTAYFTTNSTSDLTYIEYGVDTKGMVGDTIYPKVYYRRKPYPLTGYTIVNDTEPSSPTFGQPIGIGWPKLREADTISGMNLPKNGDGFSIKYYYLQNSGSVAGVGTNATTWNGAWNSGGGGWTNPAVVVIQLPIMDTRNYKNRNTQAVRYFTKRVYMPGAAP